MKKISTFTLGDMVIEYFQTPESVEWVIVPKQLRKEIILPSKKKYDSLVQVKLVGDDYPKGFCTGSTMRNSQTVKKLHFFDQIVLTSSSKKEIRTLLTDESENRFIHHVIWKKGANVLETFVSFENHSDKTQKLEMLASFSLNNLSPFYETNPVGNLELIRYQSKWSFEGRRVSQLIEELQLEPSWKPSGVGLEKFGQIGSMPVRGWFPYAAIHDKQKNVTWSVCIAQPGSWQIEAYRLDEDLCISGGLADRDYGHWLKEVKPRNSFISPTAYITVAQGDEEQTSQRLTECLEESLKAKQHQCEENLAIQFNEFCTSWGRPTEASIIENLASLKNRNIDYYVIDAGWYANEHGWEKSHGDWKINQDQFPNGLDPVLEAIIPAGWQERRVTFESDNESLAHPVGYQARCNRGCAHPGGCC